MTALNAGDKVGELPKQSRMKHKRIDLRKASGSGAGSPILTTIGNQPKEVLSPGKMDQEHYSKILQDCKRKEEQAMKKA